MGADGCEWVRWGAGSMQRHKNNAWIDKNDRTDPDLGPMAGEISPDIMFLQKEQKNMHGTLRIGVHGLGWVRVDTWIRREAKTTQNRNKWESRACFSMHGHGANASKHDRVGIWDTRRGSCGDFGLRYVLCICAE